MIKNACIQLSLSQWGGVIDSISIEFGIKQRVSAMKAIPRATHQSAACTMRPMNLANFLFRSCPCTFRHVQIGRIPKLEGDVAKSATKEGDVGCWSAAYSPSMPILDLHHQINIKARYGRRFLISEMEIRVILSLSLFFCEETLRHFWIYKASLSGVSREFHVI